jgi:flagellar motor switch protein FliM
MTASAPHPPYQSLDASLLGRPVHRLPAFAAQLQDDLAQAMREVALRRYWGGHQIGAVAFARADGGAGDGARWLAYDSDDGAIACHLDRALVLRLLDLRYGQGDGGAATNAGGAGAIAAAPVAARVTATEERLALALGAQLAAVLAARVALNRGRAVADAAPRLGAGVAVAAPAAGGWLLRLAICNGAGAAAGHATFALDQGLMASVLRGLMPARDAGAKAAAQAAPLGARLHVSLAGRLLRQEMALGALFELRVGDVIPVSLHRTDVLLDDTRLFTAAVTEHRGKLCLTAFEDAD